MANMYADFGFNQALVEEYFLKYCSNPLSVPPAWRTFFEKLPPNQQPELTSSGMVRAPTWTGQPSPEPAQNSEAPQPSPRAASGNGNGNGQSLLDRVANEDLSSTAILPLESESVPFVERRATPRVSLIPSADDLQTANLMQGRVSALVNAYRVRGHLFAELDPLGLHVQPADELSLRRYGLEDVDPKAVFSTGDMAGPDVATLEDIVLRLRETYCRTIGVEFTFIEDPQQRKWLQQRMESTLNRLDLSEAEQLRILTKLTDAEIFEEFLHTNYVGAKRFSLEGAESMIPLVDLFIEKLADLGVEEVVIGMAHRGRLNVLVNILEKRVQDILAGFEDNAPERNLGRGDVKYHLGYSNDRVTQSGKNVHVTLTFNPSHLEFVNPVVEGRARAKQDRNPSDGAKRVAPLLIHGDAAFAGQGVVAETLNLSQLEGYATGGTIHVVVNNQIGFTTLPDDSRSSRYCTDITRMLRCPVFHVNGEDPEAVAQAVALAAEFRQDFAKDVVIDLYSYRKYGHNETDEPRFTQPIMYKAVDAKSTVREGYISRLVETGKMTHERAEAIREERLEDLELALQDIRRHGHSEAPNAFAGVWSGYQGGDDSDVQDVATAVDEELLKDLLKQANTVPQGFAANPKIARLFKQRIKAGIDGTPFDWGTAETLAYATLVNEGVRIRLSGQDSRRGTFSHRHATIFDSNTGASWVPLQHIGDGKGRFDVYDSPLSEAGVLGFEFGFSLDSPDALVIWEAQFGDFANGAQVIIDQFIFSSEDKWDRLSGLVMLLPHGFEGQGPEHSSARLERFLTQCAEDNIQVCNLTSSAQIFHCLRRQVLRKWRKPLIIMSPKSLLRLPAARSTLTELATGSFQRIIADEAIDPKKARRAILCSGKVYYDLLKARDERGIEDIALIRLEQLYPIRHEELRNTLADFKKNTDIVWVQEEPWNMGAWFFMQAHFPRIMANARSIRCIARPESASPATGSRASHLLEQSRLIDEALGK